jgi:hypothetical protein
MFSYFENSQVDVLMALKRQDSYINRSNKVSAHNASSNLLNKVVLA